MNPLPRLAAATLLLAALMSASLMPACIVVDVRADSHGSGLHSDGLIHGFATAGWPADDSILKIGLLDGRSDGAIFLVQIWKLVRLEIGLLGISAGIGPLDAGIGILFYDPEPPPHCGGNCGYCSGKGHCGDACLDVCEHTGKPCECEAG